MSSLFLIICIFSKAEEFNLKRIGEKLRTLRQKRNLSMKQLADQLQTSDAQISRVENGQRKPSADLVFKISLFFGIPVERLMRDDLEVDDWAT